MNFIVAYAFASFLALCLFCAWARQRHERRAETERLATQLLASRLADYETPKPR